MHLSYPSTISLYQKKASNILDRYIYLTSLTKSFYFLNTTLKVVKPLLELALITPP